MLRQGQRLLPLDRRSAAETSESASGGASSGSRQSALDPPVLLWPRGGPLDDPPGLQVELHRLAVPVRIALEPAPEARGEPLHQLRVGELAAPEHREDRAPDLVVLLAADVPPALPLRMPGQDAPAHRATFFTVSHVRVVTSCPKVFSINDMNTGPFGLWT